MYWVLCIFFSIVLTGLLFLGSKSGSLFLLLNWKRKLGKSFSYLRWNSTQLCFNTFIYVQLVPRLMFCSNYRYLDQKTKNPYTCAAAFQVLVRPGSYKVGPPTSKITSKSLDQSFNVNAVEWVIKEKESTVLSAVLLKMDPSWY